jgi:hypothetical protein
MCTGFAILIAGKTSRGKERREGGGEPYAGERRVDRETNAATGNDR